jgi:hypothetical protein
MSYLYFALFIFLLLPFILIFLRLREDRKKEKIEGKSIQSLEVKTIETEFKEDKKDFSKIKKIGTALIFFGIVIIFIGGPLLVNSIHCTASDCGLAGVAAVIYIFATAIVGGLFIITGFVVIKDKEILTVISLILTIIAFSFYVYLFIIEVAPFYLTQYFSSNIETLAVKTKSPSICKILDDYSLREKCFYETATINEDCLICENFNNDMDYSTWLECYINIALSKKDVSICDGLSKEAFKITCYSMYEEFDSLKEEKLYQYGDWIAYNTGQEVMGLSFDIPTGWKVNFKILLSYLDSYKSYITFDFLPPWEKIDENPVKGMDGMEWGVLYFNVYPPSPNIDSFVNNYIYNKENIIVTPEEEIGDKPTFSLESSRGNIILGKEYSYMIYDSSFHAYSNNLAIRNEILSNIKIK